MRTTLDIADPVLEDVRKLQEKEGKSLGALVTELVAEGLASRRRRNKEPGAEFRWVAKPLGARVDLRDKEALWEIFDRETVGDR